MYLDEKVLKEILEAPPRVVDTFRNRASGQTQDNVVCRRFSNGTCQLRFDSHPAVVAGKNNICNLPVGFRPIQQLYVDMSTGVNQAVARASVAADGSFSIYNYYSSALGNCVSDITWTTGDPIRENPTPD